ncbi:MAG: D-2-hydroxyacid dehydrogenase [Candidatus Latescibacteria bacterium]|jgi:phosphoglycerate dehydrogenase-like enzyme|nr:D-2-hydroxyacid dehydrogenase [Candidatus Latescibacterota bacterium]MBT5831561.1 D-2-hydroxyacid dehydrogenase [Candidatus Latescibacterota bacterium]
MKLVALQKVDEAAVKEVVPDIEIVNTSRDQLLDVITDADILIGSPGNLWEDVLKVSPQLRWVHVSSAGVDRMACPAFFNSEVTLTCAKGEVVGPLLAEHAFALMLGLTRGIALCVRDGRWNRREGDAGKKVFEVGGKTMGLVGFGGVGQRLARMAQAFDMNVIALRRAVVGDESDGVTVWGNDRLDDLLAASDVVVVSVPDTPDTRGMFNQDAFSKMKKSSFLITVGRGNTVDTDALVHALQHGEIAGAGLDVVDPEPLPDEHPLWQMRNVIITPHIAGNAPERAGRNQALVLENLKRFAQGEALESAVNKTAGY